MAAAFLESETAADSNHATRDLIADLARAADADARVGRRLDEAAQRPGAGVFAYCFPGIDRVAHRFLHYARPGDFGDVTEEERERFGQVLGLYYANLDGIVERGLKAKGDQGILMVTSAHGMDPAPVLKRLFGEITGGTPDSGTHAGAPGGFLFAIGPGVRAGESFGRASIVDVVPTALYALGLPNARDQDGSVVGPIMSPDYMLQHPVIVIDSYGASD